MRASTHDRRRLHIAATLLLSATLHAQQPTAAAPHPAARYELTAATVATALAPDGITLPPDQLHLPVPVRATISDPELHLAAAHLEHDTTLQLRVLCHNPAECMPFFATITLPDHASALATLAALSGKPAPTPVAAATPPKHPEGITVGTRVTLELTDPQMRIHLPAIAIDTGAPGTDIRVASLDRKHTWRGTVLDANTVQGGVQ